MFNHIQIKVIINSYMMIIDFVAIICLNLFIFIYFNR